jgi:hypothetical protein
MGDNPKEFLESVASQDMRHLSILIRRILSNARLPSEYLLLSKDVTPDAVVAKRFHPLSAALEGSDYCYRRTAWICNVLCFEKETVHFLVFHRLLSLLADNDPKDTLLVLRWMEEYGYSPTVSIAALEVLRKCNLVYGSDLDKKWDARQRPEFCGLTAGGKYYLNYLLANADYLTAVILDVPLEHRHINESVYEHFAPRLYSLFEYLTEVRERENRQISEMKRRNATEYLLVAVDRLRLGNTLTAKILQALQKALSRATNSESRSVQAAALELGPLCARYTTVITNMEEALLEIRRKAARRPVPGEIPDVSEYDTNSRSSIRVEFHSLGEGVEAHVTMETSPPVTNAVVAVMQPDEGQRLINTAYLQPETLARDSKLVGKFEWRPIGDAEKLEVPEIQAVSVPLHRRSFGIFSAIRDHRNGARFELCVLRETIPEKLAVGRIDDCEQLRRWAEVQMKEVGAVLKQQHPIEKKIRGIGVALGNKILDVRGRERVLQVITEIDSCLLNIDADLRIVPWEWLTADDQPGSEAVADAWDTIRWHSASKTGAKFMQVQTSSGHPTEPPFQTIGLPPNSCGSWRCDLPKNLDEFLRYLSNPGGKHIVAHQKDGRFFFGTEDWGITCDDISGNLPAEERLPNEIVLSSCDAAVLNDPNLAVVFAELWKCRTWAPLTSLDMINAATADDYFVKAVGDGLGLSDAMRLGRDDLPMLKLYVQYGVHPI